MRIRNSTRRCRESVYYKNNGRHFIAENRFENGVWTYSEDDIIGGLRDCYADLIRDISEKYGVSYLPSDFKKREGYKRSIELSKKYGLYRQNFCGCVYSKIQADKNEPNFSD